jgi:hypothetical protein
MVVGGRSGRSWGRSLEVAAMVVSPQPPRVGLGIGGSERWLGVWLTKLLCGRGNGDTLGYSYLLLL